MTREHITPRQERQALEKFAARLRKLRGAVKSMKLIQKLKQSEKEKLKGMKDEKRKRDR